MRVLVIEDDQETASFLGRALKESGHVAEYAGDGQSGLELARAKGVRLRNVGPALMSGRVVAFAVRSYTPPPAETCERRPPDGNACTYTS